MVIVMLMFMHAQMYQLKKIQQEQTIAVLIQLQDVVLAHFICLPVTLKIPGVQVHNKIQHRILTPVFFTQLVYKPTTFENIFLFG